jgi:hypothetical protein
MAMWCWRSEKGMYPCIVSSNDVIANGVLVYRGLSIIDLSDTGWQPMRSSDGRRYIIINSEINNYLELRSQLRGLGDHFRSTVISRPHARRVLERNRHLEPRSAYGHCGSFPNARTILIERLQHRTPGAPIRRRAIAQRRQDRRSTRAALVDILAKSEQYKTCLIRRQYT